MVQCIGQNDLNKHYKSAHALTKKTVKSVDSGKVGSALNSIDYVINCPIKICDNGPFKNSRGLSQHFRIKHKDFPAEENINSIETSPFVNGIECPVCHVEYPDQTKLNKHFNQVHNKIVTHSDKGM